MKLDPSFDARVRLGEIVECPACAYPLMFWSGAYGLWILDCNTPSCPVYKQARNDLYLHVREVEGSRMNP